MLESGDATFGESAKHRLVEDFVVACYNGTVKPNVAEKNPTTGRDVEYLMDGPQFDRLRKAEVWSYSNAIGTGYQYRVVYKDRRFSDLERLMEVYSGTAQSNDEDRAHTEQSLYQLVLLLTKEGRLPKSFKIQTAEEAQGQKVVALVEELSKSMEELGSRVRALEEMLAAQQAVQVREPARSPSEGIPSV